MLNSRKIGTQAAAAGLVIAALGLGGQAVAEGLKDTVATPAAATERGVWFGGFDIVNGSQYSYDGAIFAFNRDMSKDGFAMRVYGSRVDFDLDPGDGRGWQGDVMLGYLFNRGLWSGGVFVGVDYQNFKLSPDDPTAKVNGTEWGFKVAADVETSRDAPHYFAVAGSYSTAFDTYWARARAGLNRSRYTFGVETAAFGSEDFDAKRLGGFFIFDLNLLRTTSPIEVTLSSGYQWSHDSGSVGSGGGSGTYGAISFSSSF
jgi:Cellulose biosynthesis protein BcsS